ncbi:MAG: methyltransferase domain-containing protein, partial [Bacteroidota bacterium]
EFKLYDGANIPYPDAHFDRVFSVNSIYFWEQPLKLLNEIARTLKVDGICVLTYAEKEFMQKLPFVKDRFKLFNRDAMEELVRPSNLNILGFESKTEEVQSKSGEFVTRNYTMVRLSNK